jgi:hypothetical protein
LTVDSITLDPALIKPMMVEVEKTAENEQKASKK